MDCSGHPRVCLAICAALRLGVGCTDSPSAPVDWAAPASEEGTLEIPSVLYDRTPTTWALPGRLQRYRFEGLEGGEIEVTVVAAACVLGEPVVAVLGPDGAEPLAVGAAEDCPTDVTLRVSLADSGEHTLLVRAPPGLDYGLDYGLAVRTSDDRLPTRYNQARTAPRDVETLFENGRYLFRHVFQVDEGLGNGLRDLPGGGGERPNMRRVHFGAFGGPDAQSCVTCHNQGGPDGAGDDTRNLLQAGNGSDPSTAAVRNPPSLLGAGIRQQIAAEMSRALQATRDEAMASATSGGAPVVVKLVAKGVSFGSLTALPDGTVDLCELEGVDPDLVVKPFGRKGRVATLRAFAEGGLRLHFGMQSGLELDEYCDSEPSEAERYEHALKYGDGADCLDPDADGVEGEIDEGLLAGFACYLALLPTSVRARSAEPTRGEELFANDVAAGGVGCGDCHRRAFSLDDTVWTERIGSGTFRFDLRDARPPAPTDLTEIEVWSDFKRWDMGEALADTTRADVKSFGIPPSHFLTPPLGGVADSAPYLHDGRAETLQEAILLHGGAAEESRDAFAALPVADRRAVIAFLETLGR